MAACARALCCSKTCAKVLILIKKQFKISDILNLSRYFCVKFNRFLTFVIIGGIVTPRCGILT